jgi:hypothetical protein
MGEIVGRPPEEVNVQNPIRRENERRVKRP